METEAVKFIVENYDKVKHLSWVLVILVSVNILIAVGKFFLDLLLKQKDRKNHRHNLIAERALDKQCELYLRLEKMTLYMKGEEQNLLADIQETELFVNRNKLFFPKEILKTTHSTLDYFKTVLTDIRKKNFEKEEELLNKYVKKFNK